MTMNTLMRLLEEQFFDVLREIRSIWASEIQ